VADSGEEQRLLRGGDRLKGVETPPVDHANSQKHTAVAVRAGRGILSPDETIVVRHSSIPGGKIASQVNVRAPASGWTSIEKAIVHTVELDAFRWRVDDV